MLIDKKGKKRRSSLSEEKLKKEVVSPSTVVSQTPNVSPSKEIKNESPSIPALPHHTLDRTKVKSAVNAVLELVKEHTSKKNTLFPDEAFPIHMQVICVKVPKTPWRQVRFLLPHSLVRDTSEVCLFVCDLKKGKKEDHEPTVAHYQDLLERNGVKGITQVIPVRMLKVEYDQYELKRRLCERFDFFLSDARVSGHVRHLLGINFVKKKKFPVPVKLDAKNLKNEIARGLAKTVITLHGSGDSSNVMVAHSKLPVDQIVENVLAVAEGLAQQFPGGWANIRGLNLKGPKSLSIPIYLTLKSSNLLDVPRVPPKKPKAAEPVEDELSTFLGTRVKVLPSGKVIVTRDEKEAEDESDTELNEILEEFKTVPKSEKKKQKKDKMAKRLQKKAISGPVLHSRSLSTTADEDSESREEESEPETQATSAGPAKKKRSGLITPQLKKTVATSDEDEDEIQEAESAYLSEMLQEQENSLLEESQKQSPGKNPQQQTKKKQKFKVGKKQRVPKSAGESKPKSFMKIKKKNDMPVNLKQKKRNKKAKLS